MNPRYVHATALAFGPGGILITGPSGAGKSALALALIEAAARSGQFARLVGDDRVALAAVNGRLVARPHPAIAGLVERRGAGIEAVAHEPAAAIALVVDLGAPAERLPDPGAKTVREGVEVSQLAGGGLPTADLVNLVIARLRAIAPG